jgi:hypothetical protein
LIEREARDIEHKIKVIKSGSLIFTEPLKNQTIQEGMLMNWPCLAQSNSEILYKWFKNSITVENALNKWDERGALFQDGMLYLSETLRSDSGIYECHAYTASKRIQSNAYLNVICEFDLSSVLLLPLVFLKKNFIQKIHRNLLILKRSFMCLMVHSP